ncbi:MAG: glycosyltransferase [Chloroflexi bacterium]|nr:glycosyltransferase [Chloroflexota bacterium]
MLQLVDVGKKTLEKYEGVIGKEKLDELRQLASPLRGARVAHINATVYGGGVSELLRSVVPLYRALDVKADWLVIPGEPGFFEVTKGFHNALQGAAFDLTDEVKETYLSHNQRTADLLERQYDYVVVHDPQPAPLRKLHGRDNARWVWRCHIDTSEPNPEVLAFLQPFLAEYDALVFTMDSFVPAGLRDQRIVIVPPAIDPLSPKNMSAPMDLCSQIVEWTGVNLDRLLITQISRFDPWKDPMGVIEVYRRVREEVPGTQLALLGQMALDDPQGWDMYQAILDEAGGDPDIHVLTNFTGIGNMEVNAFQCCSSVVLQKSLREGFGLVVSEALWKGTPVVAGRAGGIPMQMPEGVGGYLIDGIDECVEKTVRLLRDPREAQELGAAGRSHVRERFLITRLLADELRLLNSLS